MGDVVFVVIVVAFFALAALYVRACGAIVGGEPVEAAADVDGEVMAA